MIGGKTYDLILVILFPLIFRYDIQDFLRLRAAAADQILAEQVQCIRLTLIHLQ